MRVKCGRVKMWTGNERVYADMTIKNADKSLQAFVNA